jgi:hypothetical protein
VERTMLKLQFLSHYPPEVLAPEGKTIAPKTADDINDLFKEIDTEESEPKEKEPLDKKQAKSKEDEDEPTEKEEDDELELVEPDEDIEKLDLKAEDEIGDIETPPRKKEILKEYPELFKKFPFLEKMMYRDRQITELFGSFDDAKEVAEKSDTFNAFESQLLSGNTEEVLRSVKDTDEKAFNIIVDDYLPTLAKVDKEAYFHVVGNLNKRLIIEMVQEANDTNNNDLKQAALLVNQFIFGSAKFTPPTLRVEKKPDAEQSEAEQERLSYVKERFESSRDDLQSQVDNTLKATISDYIDPKGVMSPYVKKNAVADAMKILSSAVADDPTVTKNLSRLWKVAFDTKFSKDSLGKIKSFYLSKAKGQLKNAILKARAEALKDVSPRHKETDDEEKEEETPRTRGTKTITPGRPSQPKGKNDMKKGESVTDFFMRD